MRTMIFCVRRAPEFRISRRRGPGYRRHMFDRSVGCLMILGLTLQEAMAALAGLEIDGLAAVREGVWRRTRL